jgi:hypothetical protein
VLAVCADDGLLSPDGFRECSAHLNRCRCARSRARKGAPRRPRRRVAPAGVPRRLPAAHCRMRRDLGDGYGSTTTRRGSTVTQSTRISRGRTGRKDARRRCRAP